MSQVLLCFFFEGFPKHKTKMTKKCTDEFPEEGTLTQHISDKHDTMLFPCNQCNQSYVHDKSLVYQNCNFCSFKALDESDLRTHNQAFHDSQGYVLKALTELTAHIRILTADVFNLKFS